MSGGARRRAARNDVERLQIGAEESDVSGKAFHQGWLDSTGALQVAWADTPWASPLSAICGGSQGAFQNEAVMRARRVPHRRLDRA